MPFARRIAVGLIAVLALLPLGATSVQAGPHGTDQILDSLRRPAGSAAELQQQIARQLRLAPGGTQTAPNEVSYDGGKFVVTYRMPGAVAAAAPDCPSGWFCFYANYEYGYPRGKLSSCGWQDLSKYRWNDRTRSIHNATATDIDFYGHQDYGNPAYGHVLDEFLFGAFIYESVPYVLYPDQADHVIRRC